MTYEVHTADCLQHMRTMPDNAVDAVVTDPPYGLTSGPNAKGGFMGKEWDAGVPGEVFWREALRVAKPGAHLLAFGGTRTFHRLTCAIEDAGWEIRDCVCWLYGSGFSKGYNLKRADLPGYEGYSSAIKPAWEPIILARKPLDGTVASTVAKWGTGGLNVDGCRVEITERLPEYRTKGGNHSDSVAFGWNGEREIPEGERAQNSVRHRASGRFPANLVHDGSEEVLAGFPVTGAAKASMRGLQYSGCFGGIAETGPTPKDGTDSVRGHNDLGGSAARFFQCAPSDKVDLLFHRAKCIMSAWGLTQGEAECSLKSASVADVSLCQQKSPAAFALSDAVTVASLGAMRLSDARGLSMTETERELETLCETLITAMLISESDALPAQQQDVQIPNGCLVRFAETQKRTGTTMITISRPKSGGFAESVTFYVTPNSTGHGAADSATNRFRYCAKASRGEREAGLREAHAAMRNDGRVTEIDNPYQRGKVLKNHHPTVKPISLMRWLVRLVTPPDGLVLDPFTGSGTTGCAAVLEGKRFIGCELSAEYAEIARARIAHHAAQGVLNLEAAP